MERGARLNREKVMRGVFFLTALTSIAAIALICLFLFINGIPVMMKIGVFRFLLGTEWSPTDLPPVFGILPMICGSLAVTAGAIVIGVPIGVFTSVFMARTCPVSLYKILKPGINLLAGIPSVIYGAFGLAAIVPLTGNSILSASIILGIMILPTVIGLSESALRAVPHSYFEGAIALGAGKYRAMYTAVLPGAKSGVLSAVVLGIGRAIGETMAVIMVSGNQARMPVSIFKGVRTLTANIAIELSYAGGMHREALVATGVVLFVFILLINFSLSALTRVPK
jgi:phosphate transport system permease protein